ncbi:MAG: hypothetical protein ABI864_01725 [Chloroflexota bacterium]
MSRSRAAGRLPALAEPIDPGQRRLAERRLLAALRRHQKRSPLRPDLRVDTLINELRSGEPARTRSHRGQQPLTLTDSDLREVVDGMVQSVSVLRTGHRVRLPDGGPALDQVMRERVELLLAALTAAGAKPPPAEQAASRLGIPAALLDQLRQHGDLISIGPRIDVTRESWATITARLDRLAAEGPVSVVMVRDELDTARRFAERILQRWNALHPHH